MIKTILEDGRIKVEFDVTCHNEVIMPANASDEMIDTYIKNRESAYRAVERNTVDTASFNCSKLSIRREMRSTGLEDALNAIIGSSTQATNDWNDAQVISPSDPMIGQFIDAMVANFGVSRETIDGILLKARI